MDTNILITLLALISVLTTLSVQALKKILDENPNAKYSSNALAAIVAIVLSVAVMVAYHFYYGLPFDGRSVVEIIAVIFLSWLASQLGYDKIKGLISQVKATE